MVGRAENPGKKYSVRGVKKRMGERGSRPAGMWRDRGMVLEIRWEDELEELGRK